MVGVAEILTHGRTSVALSQSYFKNNSTTSSRVLMVTRSIVGRMDALIHGQTAWTSDVLTHGDVYL